MNGRHRPRRVEACDVASARYTQDSFADALPGLLAAKKLSLRDLAQSVGRDVAHLSRVLNPAEGRTASPALIREISSKLELPTDYFPEVREATVVEAVRSDATLRERLYKQLQPAT